MAVGNVTAAPTGAVPRPVSARRQLQQLPRVAGEDHFAPAGGDGKRLDRLDGVPDEGAAVLGVERRIGREQARRRAEECVPAARRRDVAVERGVGIAS